MEKIDQYLTGKLSGSELHQFQSELATDPELQHLVNDQQLLIQTVNRKALLAEIHAVAGIGASPWYANPWVAGIGSILVVGTIAATIYYTTQEPQQPENLPLVTQPENSDSTQFEQLNFNELAYEDSTYTFASSPSDNNHPSQRSDRHKLTTPDLQVCDIGEQNDAEDISTSGSDITDGQTTANLTESDLKSRNRKAGYPKGDLAMSEFIDKNMRFPGTAREKKLSGNVRVKFLVTHDGQRTEIDATCFAMRDENDKPLTNTQFVFNQKIAHLFEREAERIIRIMPLWIPATDSDGNAVLTTAELYFNFSLNDGISVYRLND